MSHGGRKIKNKTVLFKFNNKAIDKEDLLELVFFIADYLVALSYKLLETSKHKSSLEILACKCISARSTFSDWKKLKKLKNNDWKKLKKIF